MTLLLVAALATTVLLWRARRRGWCEGWSADGAAAGALLLASIGFFWQFWLLPDVSMPKGGGDLASFLYPTYRFAADSIQSGSLPFWNPHLYGGAPFAADLQSGIYYPPNLIAFLLARPFGYETLEQLAALHYPLAALCAYALGRELGLPRLGALATGLTFGLSGFTVAHLGHYNMLASAAWAPLAIALTLRAASRGRVGWALAAGGAYALVLLPGHSQVALYTAAAMALVWLLTLRARGRAPGRLAALPIALAAGAAGAAVLLIPAFELTRQSIRSDITYQQASEFAASPLGLITFLVPRFFGDSPADYWGLPWSLQEGYGYLGVSGLALAALALLAGRRDRRVLAVALLGLLALAVALGETTPLHGWLYRLVPGFDKVRAPGRALLFVDLAGALLVGFGVARLSRPLDWRDRPAVGWLLRSAALLVGATGLFVVPLFYFALLTSQDKDPAILRRVATALASLNLSLLFLILATLLLWLWSRRRARALVAPLAVSLVAIDLAVASAGFNPTGQDVLAGYRHEAIVDYLKARVGAARIDTRTGIADAVQPDLALMAGLDDVGGIFNPLLLRSFDRYWEALGSRSVPGYDLLAVRYVVARRDTPLDPSRFARVAEEPSGLAVFENRLALPRAFLAPRIERADEAAVTARLRDPGFDPRQVALIEEGGAVGDGRGAVEAIERPSPSVVVVRLRDAGGGALVLSETYYPGWSALVDGQAAPVVRAYNALMAVPLPAAAREVRLSFRPRLWTAGLALTVLAWLLIAAGTAAALWSDRNRQCSSA
ncbi:MAG TPA: YfhO family protein [Chloroflexota bacterium]